MFLILFIIVKISTHTYTTCLRASVKWVATGAKLSRRISLYGKLQIDHCCKHHASYIVFDYSCPGFYSHWTLALLPLTFVYCLHYDDTNWRELAKSRNELQWTEHQQQSTRTLFIKMSDDFLVNVCLLPFFIVFFRFIVFLFTPLFHRSSWQIMLNIHCVIWK